MQSAIEALFLAAIAKDELTPNEQRLQAAVLEAHADLFDALIGASLPAPS